ncbi:MAG: diaminohydroxyphosphoribosylaminopyrimidine deaminase [Flavobacteriales bacterium]|jgi:diaminohydroxyphosphoribosylaminopyrimidine deaminase/5-amino-6-(5-phosphoribosylamino)uracil reductase
MQRCIQLAKLGKGNVSPNPLVGSVIVYKGKIIGAGYHRAYGEGHAEVNAIASVIDKSLLSKSTIYVTLEPCAHQGKTPPCANLIIKSKISKVVIGSLDPHDKVAGKGIELIKNAGIEVITNVLKDECEALNPFFLTYHRKERPYIILKWAQSDDGYMDRERSNSSQQINWITQPETQQITHGWRAEVDAILVGKNTVINDNPSLTVRANVGKNPIRIVLDSNNELDLKLKVFNSTAKTIVYNLAKESVEDHIKWIIPQEEKYSIKDLIKQLYILNIQSIIIEGGKKTLESFIAQGLWDEARILTGTTSFGNGLIAPKLTGSYKQTDTIDLNIDQINIYKNA